MKLTNGGRRFDVEPIPLLQPTDQLVGNQECSSLGPFFEFCARMFATGGSNWTFLHPLSCHLDIDVACDACLATAPPAITTGPWSGHQRAVQATGFHVDPSDSFLKCELVTKS